MSENRNQRTSQSEVAPQSGPHQDEGSELAERRATTDRLFAVAAKSFAAMSESDSQE